MPEVWKANPHQNEKHDQCGWTRNGRAAAPQKSNVNKTVAVKEALAKSPKAKASEVVSALAAQGIRVSSAYVYALKSKAKAKKRKEKREKAVATSTSIGVSDPVQLIRQVKELAPKAGGLRNLRQLVEVLGE